MAVRCGHLAPFLEALRLRANLTVSALAEQTGISVGAMSQRLHGQAKLSAETTMRAVRACGATTDELTRAHVLDSMDRGALVLPDTCTYEQVACAAEALGVVDA